MGNEVERFDRKNLRLKAFDYSAPGYYFVTVCTKNRECILCEDWNTPCRGDHWSPVNPPPVQFPLTRAGEIVQNAILQISAHYPHASVDKYVIMPNHIHMILILSNVDDRGRAMRAPTISTLINQMKGHATKKLGYLIWQKSFYDHIIRNEEDYLRIWQYIDTNPQKWELDCYHPDKERTT